MAKLPPEAGGPVAEPATPPQGNGAAAPATAAGDIFDNLDKLRLTPDASAFSTTKHLLHVPVRKPRPSEFFRVNPDAGMSLTTIAYRDEIEREHYLVLPDAQDLLVGFSRPVNIVTCISRQGTIFLWPVPMPNEDGGRGNNAWQITARAAAELAISQWVRMQADMAAGCYQVVTAVAALSEPVWPQKSFAELLRLGFSKRIISSPDHPVIRQLLGMV
jgi:hypothetical protein